MIKLSTVSFAYNKKKRLYDRFNLTLDAGRIVGLLGKNGAGKTTLLNLIAGLIQPQSGVLDVNGYNPVSRHPDFLADVYLVSETYYLPAIRIRHYLAAYAPLYPSFDSDKLATLLQEFELSVDDQLNKLSHGTQKKFLIAFALATNCKVLLLDEPTNGLDIPSKSTFRKVLVSSVSEEQTVIISTHQVKDIDAIIDTVLLVEEGVALYTKTTDEISQSLRFDTAPSLNGVENVLYSEKCPIGYRYITPCTDGQESAIDLELLFNALLKNKHLQAL